MMLTYQAIPFWSGRRASEQDTARWNEIERERARERERLHKEHNASLAAAFCH